MKKTLLPFTHLACGNDEVRPALTHVLIKDSFAIATDAHILVLQNLNETSGLKEETIKKLDGRVIHKAVWAQLCKAEIIEVEEKAIINGKEIAIIKAITEIGIVIYQFAGDITFPKYDVILKDLQDQTKEPVQKVNLSPELITKLGKIFRLSAIGLGLSILFTRKNKGMYIFPTFYETLEHAKLTEFAIMMPIISNYEDR